MENEEIIQPNEETTNEELLTNIENIGSNISDAEIPSVNETENIVTIGNTENINQVSQNIEIPELIPGDQPGKKRGRPKKSITIKKEKKNDKGEKVITEEKTILHEDDQTDALMILLNGTAVPLASRLFNKVPEEVMLTEKQISEISKLRPESQFLGRSWLSYFGAIIGTTAANMIKANTEDKILSVIKTIKAMNDEQRKELRDMIIGRNEN